MLDSIQVEYIFEVDHIGYFDCQYDAPLGVLIHIILAQLVRIGSLIQLQVRLHGMECSRSIYY